MEIFCISKQHKFQTFVPFLLQDLPLPIMYAAIKKDIGLKHCNLSNDNLVSSFLNFRCCFLCRWPRMTHRVFSQMWMKLNCHQLLLYLYIETKPYIQYWIRMSDRKATKMPYQVKLYCTCMWNCLVKLKFLQPNMHAASKIHLQLIDMHMTQCEKNI